MVHTYNGISFSLKKKKKKEILSFATAWMNLEAAMLSDMSLSPKKHCMIPVLEKSKVVSSEAENRRTVSRGWGSENWGGGAYWVQSFSHARWIRSRVCGATLCLWLTGQKCVL